MKKIAITLFAVMLLTIILTGCYPPPENVIVEETCRVDVGSTVSLNWAVLPEEAQNKELTFASSDDSIVTVDESGSITGVSPGAADVSAKTINGINTAVKVTVVQPVEAVSAETSLTLDIGQTGCVNAQIHPRTATDSTLLYSSGDEKVAIVDEEGQVTAISAGTTSITITAHNGQEANTAITVETPVAEVTLNQEELSLYIDETETLTAVVNPADATHQDLSWHSSDEQVAIVDETGHVTAIGQGVAAITVTVPNGMSASCDVSVTKRNTGQGAGGGSGSGNTAVGHDSGAGGTGGAGNDGAGATPPGSSPAPAPPSTGGGNPDPAPEPLTDAQIQAAISEATGYAAGLGFSIVGDRQPGHSIASVAYYDYGAFVQNLKDNVNYVAGLAAGEDLSLVKLCFVREGNSVYVTYG